MVMGLHGYMVMVTRGFFGHLPRCCDAVPSAVGDSAPKEERRKSDAEARMPRCDIPTTTMRMKPETLNLEL